MSKITILSPEELAAAYETEPGQGEYPAYPRAEWERAVAEGETILQYWHWVHRKLDEEANG